MKGKRLTVSLFGRSSFRILKKFLPYCLSPFMNRFCLSKKKKEKKFFYLHHNFQVYTNTLNCKQKKLFW